jgi:hypothetical protein
LRGFQETFPERLTKTRRKCNKSRLCPSWHKEGCSLPLTTGKMEIKANETDLGKESNYANVH